MEECTHPDGPQRRMSGIRSKHHSHRQSRDDMVTQNIDEHPSTESRPLRRRWAAHAISGVLAAAVVLGVGELVALPINPDASPFYAVGATTVDRTPAWAREFAIDTFGTNDKPALFIGMSILIVLLGAVAGLLERRRRPIGSVILVLLGAVGVYAAMQRPTADAMYVFPTLVGVVAGVATLRLLITQLEVPLSPGVADSWLPRRQFLLLAGAALAVAAAAGAAGKFVGQRIAGAVANREDFVVPTAADPAPPIPAGADIAIAGASTYITPNDDFYRIDTALLVPQLTTDSWELRIHGMVDREMTLSFDDLVARTPIERVITLTCVSNEVGDEYVGNAVWRGVMLKDLLDRVGVQPGAEQVFSTSLDGWTSGFPVAAAFDGRDAMIALGVDAVIILADGQVQRTIDASACHVDLHLHKVLRLRLLHAILLQIIKCFFGCSLELGNVLGFGRFWHTLVDDRIDAARHMAAKVDTVLGRHIAHIDANSTQVAYDVGLLLVATTKQAQDSTRKARLHSPAERQPQPPITHMAKRTGPKMWARHLSNSLMVLVNQRRNGILCLRNFHDFSLLQL